MSEKDKKLFEELRTMVNDAIHHAWEQGEPGKSYEGEWEITCHFPGAGEYDKGEDSSPDCWHVVLHCYLIGPSRHYYWNGKTLGDALKKCQHDVSMWCAEEMDMERDEIDE